MGNAVDTLACYQQPDMLTCYSQVEEDDSLEAFGKPPKRLPGAGVWNNTRNEGAGCHAAYEDVGKDPMSVILWNGVQVPMKSLKDKDELFDMIYAIPNPDVRKSLNNQPNIKHPIDAKAEETDALIPLGDPDPKILNIPRNSQEESTEWSLTREEIGEESSDKIFNIHRHIQEESKELSLTTEKIGGESSDNESSYSEFLEKNCKDPSTSTFSEFSEKVNICNPVCNLLEQETSSKLEKVEVRSDANKSQLEAQMVALSETIDVMATEHELAMNIHNAQLFAKQKELNSTRQSLREKVNSEQVLRATVASLAAESSGKSEKIASLQMELQQRGIVQEAQTSENDELAMQVTSPAGTVTSLSSETNQKGTSKISNPPLFNFLRTATH